MQDPVNHERESCCFHRTEDQDVDAIFEQLFTSENRAADTQEHVDSSTGG